jgi:hypothetical protein
MGRYWNADSDLDWSEPNMPLSECDCCGEMKPDCEDIWVRYVGDTHACAKCRDAEEDRDEAADRGCWQCHQARD